jgi:hypothetical protein
VLPFPGTPYINNLDWVLSLNTPRFRGFSAGGFWLFGRDENFFEWSPADIHIVDFSLDFRPTERIRLEGRYQLQKYDRRTDGTTVGSRQLPRLKLEYQVTRSIFLRAVGELDLRRQDDLRDDSRTELPVLIEDPATGVFEPALGSRDRGLHLELLFSYQPRPGTVLFLGYNSQLADPASQGLHRASDVFFVKLSYLFRM